jgi:uncharacterized repeat protein (TIGR01451 family)
MSMQSFAPDLYTDLAVGVAVFPSISEVGGLVRYSVLITNKGPLDATEVVLTHNLPSRLDFSFSIGGDCLDNNGVITCQVGQIAAGASVNIRIFAEPRTGGSLTSRISAVGAEFDLVPEDNHQEVTIEVEGATAIVELAARRTEAGLELSWPADAGNFVLESTSGLNASWLPLDVEPARAEGLLILHLQPIEPIRFYRLRKE